MYNPTQPNQPPDELTQHFWQAWREQEGTPAPRLASLLLRRGRQLLERFQHFYTMLRQLPRPQRRRWQRKLGASLAGVALTLALSGAPVQAASITVDGTTCTLVNAITAANTDTATGGCAAGAPGLDTITLLGDVTLTVVNNSNGYNDDNGLPLITSVITIEGNGFTIARDSGAANFRIMQIAASGDLTLHNTTITGGALINVDSNYIVNGSGILNAGTLTLTNSTVSANSGGNGGGGIFNTGTLILNNSTVSGNSGPDGGGIYNRGGVMTLNNSTVSGNSGTNGGGIRNGLGTATLNNSTVSGNNARNVGSGLINFGTLILNNSTVSGNQASFNGGGIWHRNGVLMLNNSTVSGNQASFNGGGISTYNGDATISNSTVSGNSASGGNGGGIFNKFSTVTLEHSLISGNTAAAGGNEIDNFQYCYASTCNSGTVTSNNFNLFGHSGLTNADAFSNFTPSGSDLVAISDGNTPTALSAILDTTLQVNAPGNTATQALVTGSPAVDAATSGPATDQRGVARPQGGGFDIGAYELESATNTAPVANNDSYTTNEDTPLSVPAPGVLGNDTDADSNPLMALPVTGPAHGTLLLNADGSFTYTPDANFSGSDSFTYVANDGTADSNVATVNLTVNAMNDAPTAMADSYSTNEDTGLTVPAPGVLGNDSDIEGNALTAVLVSGPAHGSVTLNPDGSFSYTPAANFNGTDSFTYKANDGAADSNVATVSITVNAVNDAPVAAADSYATNEDTPLSVPAPGVLGNDSDGEGNALTAALVAAPAHGSLTLNPNGSFTYTPDANFHGSDSFTYQVNDGMADSNVATVNLTVNPVNDAPTAADDGYLTDEDVPLSVPAPGTQANDNDVDSTMLTSVLVSGPAHGSLTLNADGSFTYTPATDFNGSDSFTYKLNDGAVDSNVATVTITVGGINDAPVAANDSYATNEDTPLTISAPGVRGNDSDVDNDPLTVALVDAPLHGAVTLNPDGSFSYTPAADFHGSDNFSYQLDDGQATSNVATVAITVNAVNDAPVATDDSYATNEDVPLIIAAPGVLGNDTDADGNALTALLVSGPAHGSLTLNPDGSFSYTPAANFNGSDSFSYKGNDGQVDSNVVIVTLTVVAVNDPPVAGNDSYTTNEDTPLSVPAPGVLTNDSDPVEGSPLTAVLVSSPAHGTLTLNPNGSFSYTPAPNYSGVDSFTYKANDGGANSNIATVSITVVSASSLIDDLIAKVRALVNSGDLDAGNGNALIVKLENAKKKEMAGQTGTAINLMQAFINQVNAFSGNQLTPAQAQELINDANAIIVALNNGSSIGTASVHNAGSDQAQANRAFLPLVER